MTPLLAGGPVRMFRLSNDSGERGLSCTPDGVALAGSRLFAKRLPVSYRDQPTKSPRCSRLRMATARWRYNRGLAQSRKR